MSVKRKTTSECEKAEDQNNATQYFLHVISVVLYFRHDVEHEKFDKLGLS